MVNDIRLFTNLVAVFAKNNSRLNTILDYMWYVEVMVKHNVVMDGKEE